MKKLKKNWINLITKICLITFLLNVICFPVPAYADYSSLTVEEKRLVIQAFKQAKYYKYYESLVDGTDDIKILDVKKAREENLPNGKIKHIYLIEIDLIIRDQKFKRSTEFWITTEIVNKSSESTFWNTVWKVSVGILTGIILGFFAGQLTRR